MWEAGRENLRDFWSTSMHMCDDVEYIATYVGMLEGDNIIVLFETNKTNCLLGNSVCV